MSKINLRDEWTHDKERGVLRREIWTTDITGCKKRLVFSTEVPDSFYPHGGLPFIKADFLSLEIPSEEIS